MVKNFSKTFAFLVVVFILLFVLTGCSSDSADTLSTAKYDVNFTVVDKASTDAVWGADLTLAGEKKSTDQQGIALFKKANGSYDFQVQAVGYDEIKGEIVVNGDSVFEGLELVLTPYDDGSSDSGDGDDNGSGEPLEDITPPVFQNLYAVVGGVVYGVLDIEVEALVEDITDSDECVILNFNEDVVFINDFNKINDFEVKLIKDDSEDRIKIINIAGAPGHADYLVLEVEENQTLSEGGGTIKVKINESGQQKISDLAGNLLNEVPDSLTLEIPSINL